MLCESGKQAQYINVHCTIPSKYFLAVHDEMPGASFAMIYTLDAVWSTNAAPIMYLAIFCTMWASRTWSINEWIFI